MLLRRGLAYRATGWQWWCPKCRTILANEQVTAGRCWRHDDVPVERRALEQWYVRTTAYADRLLSDLDRVDWPARIKAMQRNWIGRSEEGGTVRYRLHDWLVSRQRFWGAPIPVVYCDRCGIVPVPEEQLPVLLPEVDRYEPSGTGRSPLEAIPEFVNTTCPGCGGPASRETDTLDGFADSNWYFLRFADPHYDAGPWNPDAVGYWLPVDWYVGGAEHAVMHLLYARFFTKVLYDEGLIAFDEPFTRLRNQGSMLSAADGRRMSKSRGNVVTPDEMVERYGADSLRAYELFIGPFEADTVWSEDGIRGVHRWVRRVWRLLGGQGSTDHWPPTTDHEADERLWRAIHRAIRDAEQQIEGFRFNTLVASLMQMTSHVEEVWPRLGSRTRAEAVDVLCRLLAPVLPYLTEEIWRRTHQTSVHLAPWPSWDPQRLAADTVEIAIQIDGRLRDRVRVPAGALEDSVRAAALARDAVQRYLAGRTPRRVVVVPGRVVNIVVN